MHCPMDHECRCVEQPTFSTADDLPIMVNLYQIAPLNQREGNPKRIDPECRRIDRVAKRDMASHTFIESILAEDAKSCCQATLKKVTLFILIREFGWSWKVGHFDFGFVLGEARFERHLDVRLLALVAIGMAIGMAMGLQVGGGGRFGHGCSRGSHVTSSLDLR